jgi:hypothetical protein
MVLQNFCEFFSTMLQHGSNNGRKRRVYNFNGHSSPDGLKMLFHPHLSTLRGFGWLNHQRAGFPQICVFSVEALTGYRKPNKR